MQPEAEYVITPEDLKTPKFSVNASPRESTSAELDECPATPKPCHSPSKAMFATPRAPFQESSAPALMQVRFYYGSNVSYYQYFFLLQTNGALHSTGSIPILFASTADRTDGNNVGSAELLGSSIASSMRSGISDAYSDDSKDLDQSADNGSDSWLIIQ